MRETSLKNYPKVKKLTPEKKNAFIQLASIGNNLNQITKKYNQGERPLIALLEVINEIKKIINLLYDRSSSINQQ